MRTLAATLISLCLFAGAAQAGEAASHNAAPTGKAAATASFLIMFMNVSFCESVHIAPPRSYLND